MFKIATVRAHLLLVFTALITFTAAQSEATNIWDRFQLETHLESYLQGSLHEVRSSVFNPSNQNLHLPTTRLGIDLRPEFTASFDQSIKAVARPRLRAFYEQGAGVLDTSFTKFHFDEASVRWNATRNLEFLAGVHYVQWGPAELFSPSNPLIHFYFDQRSVTYRLRGKALVEVDYYFNPKSFLTLLVEPLSNGEPDWISGHAFTPKGLLRWEKQLGDNPGNYFGLTTGRMERGNIFFSSYVSAYVAEAWSAYVDARVSPGTPTLYPSLTSTTGIREGTVNRGSWNGLATVGVRFEGYFDTRLEYILNTYGFNRTEWDNALTLARLNPAAGAFATGAGTELARQHYLYTSLRTDRLGTDDTLRLSLRYLHSLNDQSGAFFAAAEWSFNSYCTAIVEPMFTHGGSTTEFAQLTKYDLFASLRVAL